MQRKRILIIHTGGTLGMKPTEAGYRPVGGFLQQQLRAISELHDGQLPDFEIIEYDPLLDSANFTPRDWLRIARDIARYYDQFDAFLILHGTDTMAYTASALPLMLPGLNKNVILTGSQLPLCLRRNDARDNLITALIVAGEYRVPEVCVLFGNVLLRGCRTTKISATSFDSFDSPNAPPLATIGTRIRMYSERIRFPETTAETELQVLPIQEAGLGTLRMFPGLDPAILGNLLQTPLRGLVLESYGSGNGPSNNRGFLDVLGEAIDRGVVIVNVSQVSAWRRLSKRLCHGPGPA